MYTILLKLWFSSALDGRKQILENWTLRMIHPIWADGFITSLVDGCFCMNQLHGVLFPKFILDVETLWFWEK